MDEIKDCATCGHYYETGCIGMYVAQCCKVYGCFDFIDHPYPNLNATNCDNYYEKNPRYVKDIDGNYIRNV